MNDDTKDEGTTADDRAAARAKARAERERTAREAVAQCAEHWLWFLAFNDAKILQRGEGAFERVQPHKGKRKSLYGWLVHHHYIDWTGTVTRRAYDEIAATPPDLARLVRQGEGSYYYERDARPGVLMFLDDDATLSLGERKHIAEHADEYAFLRWGVHDRKIEAYLTWGAFAWEGRSSSGTRLLVTNDAYTAAQREAHLDALVREERPRRVPAALIRAGRVQAEDRTSFRNALRLGGLDDKTIFAGQPPEAWAACVQEQIAEMTARVAETQRQIALLTAADDAVRAAEGGWPAFVASYEAVLRRALARRLDAAEDQAHGHTGSDARSADAHDLPDEGEHESEEPASGEKGEARS